MTMSDDIALPLISDERLVLFDWSHRMEDEGWVNVPTAHKAELVVLWNLTALLERHTAESFQPELPGPGRAGAEPAGRA